MADETTDIQQHTEEVTPQQQGIKFEDILPWGSTGGDTGLSSRLKLKRNFDKIKAWMDSLDFLSNLDDKYLSKKEDDTAQGLIGFLKGIWIKAKDLFYFDKDGNIRCNDVNALGNVIVNEMLTSKDITFKNILKSDGARPGFTDGKGIWMDALQGLIQTDGLEVRGFMRVMELIINRLQLMESEYSFTEGDTVEHIDYEDNGQTLVLTMHKDHANDYTPFYPGDIIYGIRNDLLPCDGQVPDGHTVTRNGSQYTTWMRVKSVDLAKNQLRVALYEGRLANGNALVPGSTNFSPAGTAITTDVSAPMLEEYEAHEGHGYDDMLTVTRHGNVADGIDPDTGQYDEHIHQSQLNRQQAWVLSTTDKRLSFFWNVDSPIIHDENYALCLGILPDLANLPATRNRNMPSLYVNTVFYDHQHRANWPHKVVKEDRGAWSAAPTAIYTSDYVGTYTPDGTLPEGSPYGIGITVATGQEIAEPYHFRTIRRVDFLSYRLSGLYSNLTDAKLLQKMMDEWREDVDLEVSRVWKGSKLWECLVDGTMQEPMLGRTDWKLISGGTFSLGFYTSGDDPTPISGLSVRPGFIDETVVPYLLFGQEDISGMVTAWKWVRESGNAALDEAWGNSMHTERDDDQSPLKSDTRAIHITDDDLPSDWSIDGGKVSFKCTARFLDGGEEAEIINSITII